MKYSDHLTNEDIRYFATSVVRLVQDYFFYQNNLKYSVDINKLSSVPYRNKTAIWLTYRALQQYNGTDYFIRRYVEHPDKNTVE